MYTSHEPLTCFCVFVQLMSKETPVMGGNDSYVDLDRQVWRLYRTASVINRVSNFRRHTHTLRKYVQV